MGIMETQRFDSEVCNQDTYPHSMEIEEHFKCTICLNLVYKPIVQSCGHMFCFWCVHRAMNPKKESACVICRRPYLHFPRICALLHSFLLKAAPLAYAARARETQAMEEAEQVFSPRTILISPRILKLQKVPSLKEASETMEHTEEVVGGSGNLTCHDFPCALCHELLYRPVVLKCGEVFCESCLKNGDPISKPSKCPSCRCRHQGTSSTACLELHHFLAETFPVEYEERKKNIAKDTESIECSSLPSPSVENISCSREGQQYEMVHDGVGCDGCGMYPIIGARFQCKDCHHERVSYDLCGQCKDTPPSWNEGRFNQNHKPSHHMEEVLINHPHNHKQVRLMRISPSIAPLIFNPQTNGSAVQRQMLIQQEQQILYDDFDDYIDSLV